MNEKTRLPFMGELQGAGTQGQRSRVQVQDHQEQMWLSVVSGSILVVITTGMFYPSRDAVKHPPGYRTTSTGG